MHRALPGSDVVVHVEPRVDETALRERALAAAQRVPRVREIHNLTIVRVGPRTEVSLHLKLPGELPLEEAHEVASEVERAIVESVAEVSAVRTHLEPLKEAGEGRSADDAVADRAVVERIVREATGAEQRELRFLRTDDGLLAYLTIGLDRPRVARRRTRARESRRSRSRIQHASLPTIADVIVLTRNREALHVHARARTRSAAGPGGSRATA